MYIYMCIYIYMCVCVCVISVYIYMCMCIYIHRLAKDNFASGPWRLQKDYEDYVSGSEPLQKL